MSINETNAQSDLTAIASIVAAYVGNPNHKVSREETVEFFGQLCERVGKSRNVNADMTKILAVDTPAAAEQTGDTHDSPFAALADSRVYVPTTTLSMEEARKMWPNANDEQREKFLTLIDEHRIPISSETGLPVPRRPVEDLVSNMFITDPINGGNFKMLKRHLRTAYNLQPEELIAMFNLPEDFPVTAPAFSEAKRKEALSSGLGRADGLGRPKRHKSKVAAQPTKSAVRGRPRKGQQKTGKSNNLVDA